MTRTIPAGDVALQADVTVPDGARCVVVFAHGSGSSRLSPRNRAVAASLERAGLATVLTDLLTQEEEAGGGRELVFDIDLLARRVEAVVDWAIADPVTSDRPVGLFGASTGAAAALVAAANRPATVTAVVSRGGRPDLAGSHLTDVTQPTLLIVGGEDVVVLGLNREAMARLGGEVRLEIVPGATHLFEEPGALDRVARLAEQWFLGHCNLPAD